MEPIWMILLIAFLLATAAIALIVWSAKRSDKRKAEAKAAADAAYEARKQQQALDWVKRIEAATSDEDVVTIGYPMLYARLEDKAREDAARTKYRDAAHRQNARTFFEKVRDTTSLGELAIHVVVAHGNGLDTQLALDVPEERVVEFFNECVARTLEEFRNGNKLAKTDFENLMDMRELSRFCKAHNIPELTYPSDWDEIVTKYIDTPVVSDFRGTPRLSEAVVAKYAVEAIADKDVYKAKLVLAYCRVQEDILGTYGGYDSSRSRQVTYPYLMAIGSVLQAQVSVIAHRLDFYEEYKDMPAVSLHKPEG